MIHKVTWPTWEELTNSAIVVMIASFIIALVIIALMDVSFKNIMEEDLYKVCFIKLNHRRNDNGAGKKMVCT